MVVTHFGESEEPRGPEAMTAGAETPSRPPADWRRRYALGLFITDALALIWVVFGTQIAWLGWHAELRLSPGLEWSYTLASTVLIILWMIALTLRDSRDPRIIGVGWEEYRRVVEASFSLFGVIAIVAYLWQINIARGFLLISLPIGVVLLVITRWLWRQWVQVKRSQGQYAARALLLGSPASIAHIARELHRSPWAGYEVVGACVPGGQAGMRIPGVDVATFGDVEVDDIGAALAATGADTVIVTSTDELSAERVKAISWELEAGRQHLVVAPSLTDVAGPRIQMRPVAGLPLIHVETPRFSAGQRFAKRALDLFASVLGVIVLSPLLLVLAIIVKAGSPGPVLFRQVRVGFEGREFTMLKFRSMVEGAETQLEQLRLRADAGNEVMFKMRDDPRMTRVGKFMRRYSLDELPQLFNVIAGQMSLVGPRPPLPSEVERYADHVHRRFLVKPGITGLWQVSGRSTLSWDDTVRLDLSYVDNWSLLGDLLILLKTGRAALAPGDTAV
ncbi:sugar transferase [Microbacterium sp. NPDC096154]|uniref:sugar transferase n=1 Tax=Microbacterium sp. NPDC096154 TaxID=3155549 RepID=UPI003320B7D0